MTTREGRRKHWGWGTETAQPTREALEGMRGLARDRLGFGGEEVEEPVPLDRVELPPPRISPPASLAAICEDDKHARASHTLGKAYRDVVRGFRGEFANPPDLVMRPRSEKEVESVLGWCSDEGYAAIPYGGGTSVCGGVEPRLPREYPGVVTIDLGALDRVLHIDETSRSALIEAGAPGPRLEDQLREREMTMRCFPQSFEFSTLGGWVATRAGGHFATKLTHVDDMVESVRAVTPNGTWESRRLPGSGAGPSPDRMLIGSEGILGIITQAWVRVLPRPRFKASCGVEFSSFFDGARAAREISQSGLDPANCRLLDAEEAAFTGAGDGSSALLILGFESAHHPVEDLLGVAVETARAAGGRAGELRTQDAQAEGEDSVGAWRSAFLAAPYLRDSLVSLGVLSETFETSIPWERFEDFHAAVTEAAREAVGKPSKVTCRFTHVYPDGPAPYFTVLAPARRGAEVEQWDEVKAAVSEVLIDAGGTITHHHAVGRDHRPWYDRQRPAPFAEALRAAKRALDPAGVLNPGVLIDPGI
jgi:alkyldihydroxyacetonephosphate synthase